MVQEGFHLRPAHGVWVTLPVEIDEQPDPGTVAILSAGTEVPDGGRRWRLDPAGGGTLVDPTRFAPSG